MEKPIERKVYTDTIKGFVGCEQIKVITGVRRCGKSEILKLLKLELLKNTDESHIIFLNFEDYENVDLLEPKVLHTYITDRIKDDKTYYIFFDEIQKVKEWENVVASLRLRNTDIYVTGSNAQLLSSELATNIAGRYISFDIYPLSFQEFINFRIISGIEKDSNNLDKLLGDYIKIGGFPILSNNNYSQDRARKIVADIHASAVLKDVVERKKVKNVPLLQRIIAFIYDNVGKLVSLNKLVNYLKSNGGGANFDVISNYVSFLESACIIKKAPRYEIRGKKLLESNDKYYLADHSLQYAVRGMIGENTPGILENIVFNELIRRGYKVFVGKMSKDDAREIDFVAEKNEGSEKIYVQVCYHYGFDKTKDREFSPLTEIQDNFPKYVVAYDLFAGDNINGVIGIKLQDFLLKESL